MKGAETENKMNELELAELEGIAFLFCTDKKCHFKKNRVIFMLLPGSTIVREIRLKFPTVLLHICSTFCW